MELRKLSENQKVFSLNFPFDVMQEIKIENTTAIATTRL